MLFTYCFVVRGYFVFFFFFKQKTAYEMRISDWSSDVCSSDLDGSVVLGRRRGGILRPRRRRNRERKGDRHQSRDHAAALSRAAFDTAFALSQSCIISLTSRPSRIAQTTKLPPRTMSPAAHTPQGVVIIRRSQSEERGVGTKGGRTDKN